MKFMNFSWAPHFSKIELFKHVTSINKVIVIYDTKFNHEFNITLTANIKPYQLIHRNYKVVNLLFFHLYEFNML